MANTAKQLILKSEIEKQYNQYGENRIFRCATEQ